MCFKLLPKRSNLQTTNSSPFRNLAIILSSSGRTLVAPEIVSLKMISHPAFSSASICRFKFCSLVETLAYPILIIVSIKRSSVNLLNFVL